MPKTEIALIGFGVTGQAVAKYYVSRGAIVHLYDKRRKEDLNSKIVESLKKQQGRLIFHCENDEDVDFKNIGTLVISPGVKPDNKAVINAQKKGVPVKHDIMLFLEKWNGRGPVIGVTGSNGKSTVVTLLYEVLKKCGVPVKLGGNIGNSPLDWLSDGLKDKTVIILEISNYMLDYFREEHFVDIAVITNITNNHLDRYGGSMKKYAKVKSKLIKARNTEAIISADDDGIKKHITPFLKNISVFPISLETTIDNAHMEGIYTNSNGELVLKNKKEEVLFKNPNERKIKGIHNLYNIAFVYGVIHKLGIDCDNVANTIRNFKGLEHRIEYVCNKEGITYINDSKSTSPDATIKALETISQGKDTVLITGGDDKGMDYFILKPILEKIVVGIIILPGTAKEKIENLSLDIPIYNVSDMKEAVLKAKELAQAGGNILLSPATSSVLHFGSFEKRGETFKKIVEDI